jgi:peptide/histidine transporter 3/4
LEFFSAGSFGVFIVPAGSFGGFGVFKIPAGSFGVFITLEVFITAGVYDCIFFPLVSKIRIGIGIFFSVLDFVVSTIVESLRRRKAIQEGYIDNPKAVLNMSAMWLIPHNILCGMADAFNAIGQSEFYYSQFPSSMSSIAQLRIFC